jgi:hypothetical protein
MKLMQQDYPTLRKIEVELKQLGQSTQPPPDAGLKIYQISFLFVPI